MEWFCIKFQINVEKKIIILQKSNIVKVCSNRQQIAWGITNVVIRPFPIEFHSFWCIWNFLSQQTTTAWWGEAGIREL